MHMRVQRGFTLIEILIVLFIFGTIVTMPMVFLWGIGRGDSLLAATREVIGGIHEAHTNTISGRSFDGQQPSSFGIYFQTNYYVLFSGASYDVNDTNNAQTDLPTGITFSQISVPQNTIVFSKVTGSVTNFDPVQNFVILQDSNTLETRQITITSVGGVTYD